MVHTYLNYYLNFKFLQVFEQKNKIMNLAGMIIASKLSMNETLFVQLDSIEYSYRKSYIQNIKNVTLGKEQIIVPNLCDSIKLINCSHVILTSQVIIFVIKNELNKSYNY